jgi:hypothetical protein
MIPFSPKVFSSLLLTSLSPQSKTIGTPSFVFQIHLASFLTLYIPQIPILLFNLWYLVIL